MPGKGRPPHSRPHFSQGKATTMGEILTSFLMQFYGFDADTAREVLAELRDKKSLESLASGYRVVRADTPPQQV